MWDFAKGLVSRAFNPDVFVARSRALVEAARATGVTVFYARQSSMTWPEVGAGLFRMRMKPITPAKVAQFQSVNAPGSAAGEFVDDVKPQAADVLFDKFMPSAFLGTDLDWRLRSRGIKALVLAGISLETGIDGTAREAINRGYYAVIARDAVSSTQKRRFDMGMTIAEELHDVFDTDEIIAAWRKNPREH